MSARSRLKLLSARGVILTTMLITGLQFVEFFRHRVSSWGGLAAVIAAVDLTEGRSVRRGTPDGGLCAWRY